MTLILKVGGGDSDRADTADTAFSRPDAGYGSAEQMRAACTSEVSINSGTQKIGVQVTSTACHWLHGETLGRFEFPR